MPSRAKSQARYRRCERIIPRAPRQSKGRAGWGKKRPPSLPVRPILTSCIRGLLNWIHRERRERLSRSTVVFARHAAAAASTAHRIGRRAKGHAVRYNSWRGTRARPNWNLERAFVRLSSTVSCLRVSNGTNEVRNKLDNGPAISSQWFPCNDLSTWSR